MTDVPLQFQPGVSVKKLRAGSGVTIENLGKAVEISAAGGALKHFRVPDIADFEDNDQPFVPDSNQVIEFDLLDIADDDALAWYNTDDSSDPWTLVEGLYLASANIVMYDWPEGEDPGDDDEVVIEAVISGFTTWTGSVTVTAQGNTSLLVPPIPFYVPEEDNDEFGDFLVRLVNAGPNPVGVDHNLSWIRIVKLA